MMIIYDIKNVLAENTNWVQNFGNFGDGIGGTLGFLLSFITLIIVFRTYKQQNKEIQRLKQESSEQRFQDFFSGVLIPKLEGFLSGINYNERGYNPHGVLAKLERIIDTNTSAMLAPPGQKQREVPPDTEKYIKLGQDIIDLYNFISGNIDAKIQKDDQLGYRIILHQTISLEELTQFQKYMTEVHKWPRGTNWGSQ